MDASEYKHVVLGLILGAYHGWRGEAGEDAYENEPDSALPSSTCCSARVAELLELGDETPRTIVSDAENVRLVPDTDASGPAPIELSAADDVRVIAELVEVLTGDVR